VTRGDVAVGVVFAVLAVAVGVTVVAVASWIVGVRADRWARAADGLAALDATVSRHPSAAAGRSSRCPSCGHELDDHTVAGGCSVCRCRWAFTSLAPPSLPAVSDLDKLDRMLVAAGQTAGRTICVGDVACAWHEVDACRDARCCPWCPSNPYVHR